MSLDTDLGDAIAHTFAADRVVPVPRRRPTVPLRTRLLDIHEVEELTAREMRRAWSGLSTDARLKIRRGVTQTHTDILFYGTILALMLLACVIGKGDPLWALLMVGWVIWLARYLRRLCLSARRTRLAGVSPYRPKTVSESDVMGHLMGHPL